VTTFQNEPAIGVETGRSQRMRALMERLYPICRSITGDGVRATLDVIAEALPSSVALERHAVPSGTDVHDWTVNDEWTVRDAWIADSRGRRVVDLGAHTLHLVNYSVPVHATMTFEELRPHLHTLPEHPDWIPYRTTYYHRTWGFCLTQRQYDELESSVSGPYEVVVDTTLEPGELTWGEVVLPGETTDEVLFSSHVCHPSLANDNLSGITIATELIRALAAMPRRHTYRFLFAPGTIGSITWLSQNPDRLANIRHGLVLTGLGGPGELVYKQTRLGSRPVDRILTHVVGRGGGEVRGYSPYGYDERQFNALGFDLPVGRLSRTPHGEYPEYHTSADNLGFVKDSELAASTGALLSVIEILEHDRTYLNLSPHGEPQLGKRDLYPTMGGRSASDAVMAMLWTLGYSDGETSLLDIAEISGMEFTQVREAAVKLAGAGLLA
jgi:aminopeptidase-like protein